MEGRQPRVQRIELSGDEQAVLCRLAVEARPYVRSDRPTRPDELPTDLWLRTREMWEDIATRHALDVGRCRFQVDPSSSSAWILIDTDTHREPEATAR
jgi:RecB family exonuclease